MFHFYILVEESARYFRNSTVKHLECSPCRPWGKTLFCASVACGDEDIRKSVLRTSGKSTRLEMLAKLALFLSPDITVPH